MNHYELVNCIENAAHQAKLTAAKAALVEVFNEGVNRGKFDQKREMREHLDLVEDLELTKQQNKRIAELEAALATKESEFLTLKNNTDKEIARLTARGNEYLQLSEQRTTLAFNRQKEIDELELWVRKLNVEVTSFRETNRLRNSQIHELQVKLGKEKTDWENEKVQLLEKLAKSEERAANVYDAAFMHGYAAGKEALRKETTTGGSLAPDPA